MSITFHVHFDEEVFNHYDCIDCGDTPQLGCRECHGTGDIAIGPFGKHDVQLSNSNAAGLLSFLRFEFDYSGMINPDGNFMRRLELAINMAKKRFYWRRNDRGSTEMSMFETTTESEYWIERFTQLKELAKVARTQQQKIFWG